MIKSFKIRLYPTKQQEVLLWKHIGCCRFIWNYMLDYQEKFYEKEKRFLFAYDMISLLTPLKNDGEHDWLYEVSNASLQGVCKDLDAAFRDFFKKKSNHPKFKSKKRTDPKFPLRTDSIAFYDKKIRVSKVGLVKYKTDFDMPKGRSNNFKNPRISFDGKKWILSVGLECENQAIQLTDIGMGIDLGIKETAVVMFGEEKFIFHNINKTKKMKDIDNQIKHIQRDISRKYESNKKGNKFIKSNNIIKKEKQLKLLRRKQKNIRWNYIHQMTHSFIKLCPCRIVVEDLNVSGMMKNRHLSKAIQQQCFYTIIRILEYKCLWNGIELIKANRFFPSSKTCSGCGNIKKNLMLKDRKFICPECGLIIDRDENAAINLMRYKV